MRKKTVFNFLVLMLVSIGLLTGCSTSFLTSGKEEKYPTRQIEYVVPYAPGGGVDLTARLVGKYLSKEWGQPIVIVNKPGGGGVIGAQYALKDAPKDGYTVLANNVSNTTMLWAGNKNPAVKVTDQVFASRVAESPMGFVVKGDGPWKDFKEFSDWVKKNPEKLTWTSVGTAGFSTFGVGEWLKEIGVDIKKTKMVTSTGTSDSLPKVAGGHVVLAVHTVGEMYSLAKSGKVKILAVQSPQRSSLFPDVPTTSEQGFKNLTVQWWTGISFPVGTPDYIIKKWDDAIAKLLKDPAFIKDLENIHLNQAYLNSTDFLSSIQSEISRYTNLAENIGIRK